MSDLFYWDSSQAGGMIKEGSIDVHPEDAERLGLRLNHPMNLVNINGRMISTYKPLTIEIAMYQIDPRKYAGRCAVCGESHEELVIAYLDWYRVYRDTNLLKRSEERDKRWQAEGFDRSVAHRLAELGVSGEEVIALAEHRGKVAQVLEGLKTKDDDTLSLLLKEAEMKACTTVAEEQERVRPESLPDEEEMRDLTIVEEQERVWSKSLPDKEEMRDLPSPVMTKAIRQEWLRKG